jgi:hypothetical protein
MRFDRYTVALLTLRPDAPLMTDAEAVDQRTDNAKGR